MVTGLVFEDVNYSGGSGTAYGFGDWGLSNVRVEVYDSGNNFLGSVMTVGGAYSFPISSPGVYTFRVVASTIGDADTPPAAGYIGVSSGAVVEQTYERNGVSGNGGDGALGGNDAQVDDTATLAGAGPGDVNVSVTVANGLTGVDFGFSYNLIVNTKDSGQGSLRRFLLNANAIRETNRAQFSIPLSDPNFDTATIPDGFLIAPPSPLPAITGDLTLLDGRTQESNRGNQRAGRPDIVLDGAGLGPNDSGLYLQASSSTIAGLDIRRFNNNQAVGSGTGIFIDGTSGGDNNTIDDNYLTLNSNDDGFTGAIALSGAADGNHISDNTIEANFGDGIRFADSANSGNVISGNFITNSGDDGARLAGDSLTFETNTVRLSERLTSSACGVELVEVTNSTLRFNTIENNGNQGGICLVNVASTGNTIGPFNTIRNHSGPGIYSDVSASVGNTFTRNNIYDNAGLGIDLDRDGVTDNDPGDVDTGTNDLLNFPVLSDADIALGLLTIRGETRPGARVEFFVIAADPSGHGEGATYLGSGLEGSGSDGSAAAGTDDPTANEFSFSLPIGVLTCGDTITATATDGGGNTSEFSLNFKTPYCSLLFDGSDDIVPTMNLPFLTAFTVEAWVYRTADSGGLETFVSDADSTYTAADFSLFIDDETFCPGGPTDEFAFRQRLPDDLLCSGVAAASGTWFHVAVSRNASDTVRLFVNGALASSKVMLDPTNSSGVFTFGRAGDFPGQYFPGSIAEVRLANTALYTIPFTPPTAPLPAGAGIVGLWHMDEGSGQNVLDNSGSLRHGTLGSTTAAESNDPIWSSGHPY
jgi:parallel beta-helix repeat protein